MLICFCSVKYSYLFIPLYYRECKAALLKTSALTEEEKNKWAAVLTVEMMSSVESGAGSDSDDDSVSTFIKHPLPWRCESVLSSLDHKA